MNSKNKKTFAKNLKLLMEHRKENQNSLSVKTGLDQKTISNYLRPEVFSGNPTLRGMELLAQALKVELWKLLVSDSDLHFLTEGKKESVEEMFEIKELLNNSDYAVSKSDLDFIKSYFKMKISEKKEMQWDIFNEVQKTYDKVYKELDVELTHEQKIENFIHTYMAKANLTSISDDDKENILRHVSL